MRSARAPKGLHTEVDIKVTLKDGRKRYERQWDTPIAIKPAYHKAMAWLDNELKELGVEGRTLVHRIQVDVRYVEGEYEPD